jgi:hypothetical protein
MATPHTHQEIIMQVSKYNRLALAAIAATALGFSYPGGQHGGVTDIGQTPPYAQTAWAGVHRDARNSDFAPFVAPAVNQVDWEVLDGAVTLLAASIGPEGNRYVTTGRGPGTSHLHAFDRDGNLLWESPPQASPADLDSAAVASATLVDRQGDVYVSDFDQFWAFHSDGTLKWVSALPTPGQSFVSAIITKEGFVGGVTTGGEVVLFDRNDGSSAVPVFQLPAGDPPPAAPPRPGLWQGGLMDPSIIPLIEAAFFGEMMQVTNTPAVDPRTGRIEDGSFTGLLYGLDIVGGEVQIAFAAPMGGGSGTSPAISPDGTQVYAADSDAPSTRTRERSSGRPPAARAPPRRGLALTARCTQAIRLTRSRWWRSILRTARRSGGTTTTGSGPRSCPCCRRPRPSSLGSRLRASTAWSPSRRRRFGSYWAWATSSTTRIPGGSRIKCGSRFWSPSTRRTAA